MVTIIIPTFNEEKTNYLAKSLALLSAQGSAEIIVVDSHSTDNTRALVSQFPNIRLIDCEETSRAARLNRGINAATNEMVLLHHPRSLLSNSALTYLLEYHEVLTWGGFTHKFDYRSPLLNFTSWWSNYVRADVRSIFYLDHCIYAKKSLLLEVGLLPEIDIFEDTEISKRLKKLCKGKRLSFISLTSAIRFKSNGVIAQSYMNQKLKWKYYFNTNHKKMNDQYEKGLSLNTNYSDEDQ